MAKLQNETIALSPANLDALCAAANTAAQGRVVPQETLNLLGIGAISGVFTSAWHSVQGFLGIGLRGQSSQALFEGAIDIGAELIRRAASHPAAAPVAIGAGVAIASAGLYKAYHYKQLCTHRAAYEGREVTVKTGPLCSRRMQCLFWARTKTAAGEMEVICWDDEVGAFVATSTDKVEALDNIKEVAAQDLSAAEAATLEDLRKEYAQIKGTAAVYRAAVDLGEEILRTRWSAETSADAARRAAESAERANDSLARLQSALAAAEATVQAMAEAKAEPAAEAADKPKAKAGAKAKAKGDATAARAAYLEMAINAIANGLSGGSSDGDVMVGVRALTACWNTPNIAYLGRYASDTVTITEALLDAYADAEGETAAEIRRLAAEILATVRPLAKAA